MTLSTRKENILATIVRNYIRTGEPMGSKSLCEELGGVSSATIRNEMSELDALGYLAQQHTSAGRIPTEQAFRLYVDSLMVPHRLNQKEQDFLDSLVPSADGDVDRVLHRAAQVLSDLTRCAALLTVEPDPNTAIHKVELLPMSSHTALLVMVTSAGTVESRMFRFGAPLSATLIERFMHIADRHLIGTPLSSLQPAMLQTLIAGAGDLSLELTPLMSALADLVAESSQSRLELTGQSNLLMCGEFSPMRVREVIDLFLRSEEVLTMLDVWNKESGVILGGDTVYRALESSSMVVARYRLGGNHTGYLGILGPVRMDYAAMLPSICYFTEALERAFCGENKKGRIQ